jgi:NAD(P)-dependent dehydrogenase (short-subunit alcohol dehydrogenase family)
VTGHREQVTREATWDRLLDRSLLGYTRLGPMLRRRRWPADPPPGALAGRPALVTGANRGIGKAIAEGLARLGAEVHLVVRDTAAGQRARADLLEAVPGADVRVDGCDISSLAAVREYAATVAPGVRVLVHNAGVLPATRQVSVDGNELTLATHVLGPHLLTALLAPSLAADARVIWLTSGGMYTQGLELSDPQYERGDYRGAAAYARTKRMQAVMATLWAEHLAGTGVGVHAAHPGWVATGGVATSLPRFAALTRPLLRGADQGADTVTWLAATDVPGLGTGRLWHDRAPRPLHYLRRTRETCEQRRQLWRLCVDLTGAPAEKPGPADATQR